MRSGTLGIVVSVVGCIGGQAFGGAAAQKAWEALFAEADPAAATKQIDAVLAACGGDAAKLKALIAADAAYEAFTPGWKRAALRVGQGQAACDVEFLFRVPKGYSPKRSFPLLLAAHWQDGSGDGIGRSMEILLGKAADDYVLLAPTLPDKERGFVAAPLQVEGYLRPLAWARVNLNIDDDRIYVAGYGQGGYVAWHLAVMHPRLFAAAVPMAGLPYFQGAPYTAACYLENLDHLPVWAVWGRNDRGGPAQLTNAAASRLAAERLKELSNARFKGTELPGVGHYQCWPKGSDFVRFLSAHKRRREPEKFRHYFHLPAHARGYYVEALKGGRRPMSFDRAFDVDVPSTQPREPTRQELFDAVSKHLARRLFKMWVELDRSANALQVRPFGITKVRVFVTEGLFDLSKPAELRFGRAKWTHQVPLSPRCILLHYAATRDAARLVHNEIDLQILGETSVRYE